MPELEIVLYPDPVLRKSARVIQDPRDRTWPDTAHKMLELMYRTGGVGLAAPQVGISERLLVLNPAGDPGKKDQELVLINPEIVSKKGKEWGQEGCLSFPGIFVDVQRAKRIVVRAVKTDGEQIEFPAEDFLARVILHELDHLNGILFIDRFSPADRIRVKAELEKLELDYRAGHAAP